ncbi:hypothetical protein GT354_18490, partial [Streptomyces sp. SID3343]|nr:hypothetical protein [Streptomyces sp. SID3343]
GDPKDTAKPAAKKTAGRGRLGRLWAAIRLGKLRDWVAGHWQAAFEARVARVRAGMASRHAGRMLRVSALRYWLRCLLITSATMPLAVAGLAVGALTRLSGSTAPIHTGRRLRKHLIDRAREARLARDDAVADQLDVYEYQDFDDDAYPPVADTVVEAPRRGGAAPTTTTQGARGMSETGGFPLTEMCEAIQAAAAAWEPSGAMQAVALTEAMPEALATFAGAFAVLANKADERMPFHSSVADALDGLHQLLLQSASGAEDVPALVHTLHADDIARHREPRPGEEMWDISNNE